MHHLALLLALFLLAACQSTESAQQSAQEDFQDAMADHYGEEYPELAEDLDRVWKLYSQVRFGATTIWQEARLDSFREKYGELPINLRAHTAGPDGDLGERDAELLFLAETLAGSEELDAGALLVIDAIATQVIGTIGGATGGAGAAGQ